MCRIVVYEINLRRQTRLIRVVMGRSRMGTEWWISWLPWAHDKVTMRDIMNILNSLASRGGGGGKSNFQSLIFKFITQNNSLDTRCEIPLQLLRKNLTNKKLTLLQVMAWCLNATSHSWANFDPDLCYHMASLGHHDLMDFNIEVFP